MTMPSTNINLIADVRNNFMQDSSGNAQLTSTKYRDGAGKGTGNVALTDFANVAWRNGRNVLHQPNPANVKPYNADGGVDQDNYANERIKVRIENGLPVWQILGPAYTQITFPIAWYMSSGFKVMRPGIPHTITWQARTVIWQGNYGSLAEYTVRGYKSGYKSGGELQHQGWRGMNASLNSWRDNSYTFTPNASYPYIAFSTRVFYQETDMYPRSELEIANIKVAV